MRPRYEAAGALQFQVVRDLFYRAFLLQEFRIRGQL